MGSIRGPGHYKVHGIFQARADRGSAPEAESNQIGIDIIAPDTQWQANELARNIAILKSTTNAPDTQSFYARRDAAHRITYLDTPEAVREMARGLGLADTSVAAIFQDGLRSSQHSAEAIAVMKEFLHSSSEPVPPIFLQTLAALDKSDKEPQNTLAQVVGQKQGSAKAISLKTLIDNTPATGMPPDLRSGMIAAFPDLPISEQSALLEYQWNKIDSPEMIPVLRRIYESAPQKRYRENPLLSIAAERLYGLDTSQTRTLLLEDMKRPEPRLPYRTLALLPDQTIPELDPLLLDHLQHNGGLPVEELIARYATASIFEPVKEFYANRDAGMRSRVSVNVKDIAAPACEPPLIAYFLRVDPVSGEKLLRQSLAERSYPMGHCWLNIIGKTALYYSGPGWEKVAIDALQDPSVPVKIDAVKSLGLYGLPTAKPAIMDAFRYWHEWWVNRGPQNDESLHLEQALVHATVHPGNGKPSPGELAAIRNLCLSANCKEQVPPN